MESPYCETYSRAFETIGRRWTGAILRAMITGRCRFSELVAAIPGLSDRLLSERLRELEAIGVIERTVTPSKPVLIEYHLTEMGQALSPIVDSIDCWATTWLTPAAEAASTSIES